MPSRPLLGADAHFTGLACHPLGVFKNSWVSKHLCPPTGAQHYALSILFSCVKLPQGFLSQPKCGSCLHLGASPCGKGGPHAGGGAGRGDRAHVGAQLSIQQRYARQNVFHHCSWLWHLVVAHLQTSHIISLYWLSLIMCSASRGPMSFDKLSDVKYASAFLSAAEYPEQSEARTW